MSKDVKQLLIIWATAILAGLSCYLAYRAWIRPAVDSPPTSCPTWQSDADCIDQLNYRAEGSTNG